MFQRVSAILLAAGSSRRMGQSKQLLPLNGKPFIRHCLDSIIAAGITDIVVVLGRHNEELLKILEGLPVKIAFNENNDSEMAASVRIGLCAVDRDSSGVLVNLSDHPLVSAGTLKALVSKHKEAKDKIILPLFNDMKGHPTLFPRQVIEEIFSGVNMRQIINRDPDRVKLLDVADEGVIIDIDTKEDYEKAVVKYLVQLSRSAHFESDV